MLLAMSRGAPAVCFSLNFTTANRPKPTGASPVTQFARRASYRSERQRGLRWNWPKDTQRDNFRFENRGKRPAAYVFALRWQQYGLFRLIVGLEFFDGFFEPGDLALHGVEIMARKFQQRF